MLLTDQNHEAAEMANVYVHARSGVHFGTAMKVMSAYSRATKKNKDARWGYTRIKGKLFYWHLLTVGDKMGGPRHCACHAAGTEEAKAEMKRRKRNQEFSEAMRKMREQKKRKQIVKKRKAQNEGKAKVSQRAGSTPVLSPGLRPLKRGAAKPGSKSGKAEAHKPGKSGSRR